MNDNASDIRPMTACQFLLEDYSRLTTKKRMLISIFSKCPTVEITLRIRHVSTTMNLEHTSLKEISK